MTEVIRAAEQLQRFCQEQCWSFCIIGGLALQRWGEARETVAVDLTLLTGSGREEAYVHALLRSFEARVEDPTQFALNYRVLLLRASSGVGLDVALGGLPFEEAAVARSSLFEFPGPTLLRTCSAEDLIVMKAFASRQKDWLDVDGIIIRQTGKLDWRYIRAQLKPLAEIKDAPEILTELEQRRIDGER